MIVQRFGDGDPDTLLRLQALSHGDRVESQAIGLQDAFAHHNQAEIERILANPDLTSEDPAKRTAAQLDRQRLGAKMQARDRAREMAIAFVSGRSVPPDTQGRGLDEQLGDYYAEQAKANPLGSINPQEIFEKGAETIVREHAEGVRDNRVAATELLKNGELSIATEIYRDEKAGRTEREISTLEGQRSTAEVSAIGEDYEAKYGKPLLKHDDGGRFEYMARMRQSGGDTRPVAEICRELARSDMDANQLRLANLQDFGTKPERRPQLEVELQRGLYQKQHSDALEGVEAQRAIFGGNVGTESLAREQLAAAEDMLEPARDPFGVMPRDLKPGVERAHFDQIDNNLTNTLEVQRAEKLKLAESTGKIFSTIAMVGALMIGQPELLLLFDVAANLAKMKLKSSIAGEAYDNSADVSAMGENLLLDAGIVGFAKVAGLAKGARAAEDAVKIGEDVAKVGEGAANRTIEHVATAEEQAASLETHLDEAIRQQPVVKEPPRRIAEVFTGPNLDSARELAARNPGAQIIAAEGSHLPPAEEIARFQEEGHQFVPDHFGESIPAGSLDEMYARYPLPHAKGMEGIGAGLDEGVQRVLAENPGLSPFEAMLEASRRAESRIESVRNLAPHALEKLKVDGTLDLTFWEAREIMPEVQSLAGKVHIDPTTGQRFCLVISSPANLVPRAGVGAQGWGVPSNVTEVTRVVLQKVLLP